MNRRHLVLFVGLLALPAYTFQDHVLLRFLQCCISIAFAAWAGGKIRYRASLVLFLTITGIHILTPSGLVLFRIGDFPFTLGSLEVGVRKSLLIIGLIYLSRFVVRTEWLSIENGDSLLALVLKNFEGLTSRAREKGTRTPRSLSELVRWFDELLLAQTIKPTVQSTDLSTERNASSDDAASDDADVHAIAEADDADAYAVAPTAARRGADSATQAVATVVATVVATGTPQSRRGSAGAVFLYVVIQWAFFILGRTKLVPDLMDLF